MKNILTSISFFLIILFSFNQGFAQSTHNHAKCGVMVDDGLLIKQRLMDNRRNKKELTEYLKRNRTSSTMYAPVVLHIVRSTDGTGGTNVNSVLNFLCTINENFASMGIQFYLHQPVDFIDNSLLYDDGNTAAARYFMQMYKVEGPMNVYFVNNTPGNGGYYLGGVQNDFICIPSYNVNDVTTGTHEFGHFFTLPHIFFGWEDQSYSSVLSNTNGRTPTFLPSGIEVENIARTGGQDNCQIAADGFCDTNPSYSFGSAGSSANNGCEYMSTAHDPYGYMFRPQYIAPKAASFTMTEDNGALYALNLRNLSTKDKLYPRTLVVLETIFKDNGNTTVMWSDTIGNSDTTDFYVPANASEDIIQMFGPTGLDVKYGFINMGNYMIDLNISSPSTLSFIAAQAKISVNSTGDHTTSMDSLMITNTSATDTVFSGATINIQEILTDTSTNTNVSTASRSIVTTVDIAPGESFTMQSADLSYTGADFAGLTFEVSSFSPKSDTIQIGSDNYMSYYSYIGCLQQFTAEQSEAIQLDFASRAYLTNFPTPAIVDITDTVSLIFPSNQSISPTPLTHFTWNGVSGATMYHFKVYEVTAIGGIPVTGGVSRDFLTYDTDVWINLTPNKYYKWEVTPKNITSICDNTYKSTTNSFRVLDWTVGVDDVLADIESTKIYPNPAGYNADITLEINSRINGTANVAMFNSIGQEVIPAFSLDLKIGNNIQNIMTSALSAGIYVLNIETEKGIQSHKVVIKD